MNSDEKLKIAFEDMHKMLIAQRNAQVMIEKARVADLEYKAVVQHIYIKYGLSLDHSIDDATGLVSGPGLNSMPVEENKVENE